MASFIQFQFRRGPSTEWTAANPILADGEMGIEKDTGLFKIGNGINPWAGGDGPMGPTGPLGYGGLRGFVGDPGATGPIIDNIVLNAYVHHAVVNHITYDFNGPNCTKTAKINISIYGNSTAYRVTPDYSLFDTSISPNPQTFNNVILDNNLSSPFQVDFITANISSSLLLGHTYPLKLTIDTSPAGGTTDLGYTTSVTPDIIIPTFFDTMGPPYISSTPTVTPNGLSVVTISGNSYYKTGTILTNSDIQLSNIYNNNNVLSNGFTVMTNTTPVITTSQLTGYPAAPELNTTYSINTSITYTVTDTNFSQVNGTWICNYTPSWNTTLTNALNETTLAKIYPPAGTNLGYVNPSPDEVNIPLKSNTNPTITSIKRCQYNDTSPPAFNSSTIGKIIVPTGQQITTMYTYDPVYFPFNGNIYSNNLTNIAQSYILPSVFSLPNNGSIGNPNTNHLVLQITTPNTILNYFNLELVKKTSSGFVTDGTEAGVSSVHVCWKNDIGYNSGWYDATGSVSNNSTPANNNTYWQLGLNDSNATGGNGTIYIIVSFTGYIGLSNINIT